MFFQFIVAVLLVTLTSAFSPAQYCRVDEELGVDFCASITSFANVSSTNADVYIRISSRFRSKNGWSAIGTGETMAGALMFVFYPSANGDEATVSLRTAKYKYPLASKL
jgi:hypothetical protein